MKSRPWLRLYTEVIDDEKLLLLAFEDRWHYIALLACKGKGLLDRTEEAQLMFRKVALKLGLATRELEEVARRLSEVGLVDRTTLQPTGWDERQFLSDSSTDRVRAYRDRLKQGRNVSETTQDTETEADTETKGRDKPAAKGYPDEFEEVWARYPKRPGASKSDAHKAWNARLKAGAKAEDMLLGTMRYAAYCAAMGTEPQFIKQPATFFGPGEHYLSDWTPPAAGGVRQPQRANRLGAAGAAIFGYDDGTPQ